MSSKKSTSKKPASKSVIVGRSQKTGHSIYVSELEYNELLDEVKKLSPTDNEAIFRGQLHALLMQKFKGRFSLKQITAKKYKELKSNWSNK